MFHYFHYFLHLSSQLCAICEESQHPAWATGSAWGYSCITFHSSHVLSGLKSLCILGSQVPVCIWQFCKVSFWIFKHLIILENMICNFACIWCSQIDLRDHLPASQSSFISSLFLQSTKLHFWWEADKYWSEQIHNVLQQKIKLYYADQMHLL